MVDEVVRSDECEVLRAREESSDSNDEVEQESVSGHGRRQHGFHSKTVIITLPVTKDPSRYHPRIFFGPKRSRFEVSQHDKPFSGY